MVALVLLLVNPEKDAAEKHGRQVNDEGTKISTLTDVHCKEDANHSKVPYPYPNLTLLS